MARSIFSYSSLPVQLIFDTEIRMVHFFMKKISSGAAVLTDVRVRQHSFCDGNIFIFSITFRQKFFHSFMIITVYRDSIKKWKSNIIFKNPCRQRIHATYKGSYFSNFEGIWRIRFPPEISKLSSCDFFAPPHS